MAMQTEFVQSLSVERRLLDEKLAVVFGMNRELFAVKFDVRDDGFGGSVALRDANGADFFGDFDAFLALRDPKRAADDAQKNQSDEFFAQCGSEKRFHRKADA